MQARYYDPVIGRFYSNDPVGFTGIDTFNRYAYVANNPYKYTDPTGMSKEFDEKQEQREKKKYDGCQQDSLCYNAIPWRNSGSSTETSTTKGSSESITTQTPNSSIPIEPGLVSVCPTCYLIGGGAINKLFTFKGAGWFGEKGLRVGKYRIDAMYANPRAGSGAGTAFSFRGPYSRIRLDYGVIHGSGNMGWHSTIRFRLGGFYQFGSTAQRTWHPPWRIIKK
jgi:hypothetical protein